MENSFLTLFTLLPYYILHEFTSISLPTYVNMQYISHADTAGGDMLELEGGATVSPTSIPTGNAEESRAADVEMIVTGSPATNFPSQSPLNFYVKKYIPCRLVLPKGGGDVWRHRDIGAVYIRRPYGDVVVALVAGGERGGDGDLLILIGYVDIEGVVDDADAVVGVAGGDGDLDC